MKAIVSLTKEEHEKYTEIYHNLVEKTKDIDRHELYSYSRVSGYAHYKFTGRYTQKLSDALGREPTPEEIIMLIDRGFSHFGASCSLRPDRTFNGTVNTD